MESRSKPTGDPAAVTLTLTSVINFERILTNSV
jgi:hypothetical protein